MMIPLLEKLGEMAAKKALHVLYTYDTVYSKHEVSDVLSEY